MGLFSALGDTVQLLKNTFVIIHRNPEIFKPTARQVLWGVFPFVLVLGVVGMLFAGLLDLGSVLSLFYLGGMAVIFYWILLFPLIKIYYRASQVWIVYQTFTGKKVTFRDGIKRARKNKGDILIFGIVEIIISQIVGRMKRGTGKGGLWVIVNIIMGAVGFVIEEGWDLISHYLLPAAIIEEKTALEVVPEIKKLKENVPAALAGTFAIDFVGDSILGIFILFIILSFIFGIILSVVFQNVLIFVFIFLGIIAFLIIFKTLVDMVKTVYFTLFYAAVAHPMAILPEYRDEVTSYLKYEPANSKKKIGQIFSSVAVAKPADTSPKKPEEPPTDQELEQIARKVAMLIPYVRQYRRQGYSDKEIKGFLKQNNWPDIVVENALEEGGK
jgi:hypothetical protein